MFTVQFYYSLAASYKLFSYVQHEFESAGIRMVRLADFVAFILTFMRKTLSREDSKYTNT